MFYCVGETGNSSCNLGKGSTLEAAICDWANEQELHLAATEFNTWKPLLIEGDQIMAVFNTTVSKG
jgi:hypothetical protein